MNSVAILKELGGCPAAPFHEQLVAKVVLDTLNQLGLRCSADHYGNLVAKMRAGDLPPVALVAHLDHPGFEIVATDENESTARLLGVIRLNFLKAGVPVLAVRDGERISGQVVSATELSSPRDIELKMTFTHPVRTGDWGVFDLPDFEQKGDIIRMRAADDLAGVAAALATAARLIASRAQCNLWLVFTRAEEVGLVGASLLAEEEILPADVIVISLEASRELPGAKIGEGPVIRVGDAASSFHPEGERLLLAARQHLLESDPAVKVQRQLMSGGVCEATTFTLRGYRTAGVALPLGNYHNMGPDETIAAEYIHQQDFLTEIDLLVQAIQLAGQPSEERLKRRLDAEADKCRPRLRDTAGLFGWSAESTAGDPGV